MAKPKITFQCYNTVGAKPVMDVKTVSNEITLPDFKGHASSEPIQFNVNRDPVKGTIRVDSKNDGVCVAKLNGKYVFTDSAVEISPDGSNPQNISKDLVFGKGIILSDQKTINFHVHRVGATVGNITLIFKVEYKRVI